MGENKWKASASWPPASAKMQRLYLRSDGRANSLWGNGRLDAAAPGKEPVDRFRYDPLNPVPTVGGGDCCNGGIVVPGAFDQRSVEADRKSGGSGTRVYVRVDLGGGRYIKKK